MSLKFDIRGFDEIKKAIDKRVEAVTVGVDKEMDKAVLEINAKQIQYTPVDTGRLRGANSYNLSQPLNKTIENPVDYAGYIEFGTGGLVNVPPGLEDQALPWKGAGIRKVNMRPQPFFFRTFFEEAPKMLARIKNIISQ